MGKKKSSKSVSRSRGVVRIARFMKKGRRVGSSSNLKTSSSSNSETLTLADICREVASLPPSDGYEGYLFGSLTFSYDGVTIDCRKKRMPGILIPQNIHLVGDMSSDARFILVVQKFAAYNRLVGDRFYDRFPSIVVRTPGQPPDLVTMLFLKRMETEFNLPVLALADSDPYAFKMLSAYGCRPKIMSHDIAVDIKWLGIRPTDWDNYQIPDTCRLPMTDQDIRDAKDLLNDDFVTQNRHWVKELLLMLKSKRKVEIEALNSLGFVYLTSDYLPRKLNEKDWV